jgi:hypothetical protein
VGPGFSPLDEQLGLLPSQFSPFLIQTIVRLGTVMPFEQVPSLLAFLFSVHVAPDTVRRLTEQAGAAQVAVETAELERIEREQPIAPQGPELQQISADGAMVPLVGGDWAEVRTMVIGSIERGAEGGEARAGDLSYFSRLCTGEEFVRQATVPLYQRGTEHAETVVAVMDGAEWLQQLIDGHCPDAVRILDFPHAAEYLCSAAQAAYGVGTRQTSEWLDIWLHELKHGNPDVVLGALRRLPTPTPEAKERHDRVIAYLQKRRAQISYAAFREQGYPIGSGAVESANKLVVEARLKGSGMHWARHHVTPMVALRAVACGDRWSEVWRPLWDQLRRQAAARRQQRRETRQAAAIPPAPAPAPPAQSCSPRNKLVVDGRPTADHPWRRGYDPARLAQSRFSKT